MYGVVIIGLGPGGATLARLLDPHKKIRSYLSIQQWFHDKRVRKPQPRLPSGDPWYSRKADPENYQMPLYILPTPAPTCYAQGAGDDIAIVTAPVRNNHCVVPRPHNGKS